LQELCDIWLSQPPVIQQAIQDKVSRSPIFDIDNGLLMNSGDVVGTGEHLSLVPRKEDESDETQEIRKG